MHDTQNRGAQITIPTFYTILFAVQSNKVQIQVTCMYLFMTLEALSYICVILAVMLVSVNCLNWILDMQTR